MNMSLIAMEGNCGDIDDNDSLCHGYHIIKFSSYPYTLQSGSNIDDQVIYSGKLYLKELFKININSLFTKQRIQ